MPRQGWEWEPPLGWFIPAFDGGEDLWPQTPHQETALQAII